MCQVYWRICADFIASSHHPLTPSPKILEQILSGDLHRPLGHTPGCRLAEVHSTRSRIVGYLAGRDRLQTDIEKRVNQVARPPHAPSV
ncbi:hypothetical protein CT19431_MP30384 [Cupriavidus taiwanensis]|nr:hypothetical protein CT19431_MP30384 [Cupriavidus taiwanensis]